MPDEKIRAKPCLQILDMLADNTVAYVQFAGRRGKAGMPCRGLKYPERIEMTERVSHVFSVVKSFAESKLNALFVSAL